ncbi:uncharacterized protein BKCO1_5000069 [Diplodia corticola]|uniref:Uncharacterized protein n=1 Tax=Diplodia corticola TaxID=236234 RepID=A0A1J9RTW3_9PEZI|nr:uncharacterized protein BKCO1_5000069 [Diplodia corticola]OJD31308.1 hypothetical protein BKCO1_5000069 [Diplodia corticola]
MSNIPSPHHESATAYPEFDTRRLLETVRTALEASSAPEQCHGEIIDLVESGLKSQTYQSQQDTSLYPDDRNDGQYANFSALSREEGAGAATRSNGSLYAGEFSGYEHPPGSWTQPSASGLSSASTQPDSFIDGTSSELNIPHWPPQQGEHSNAHTEGWEPFGFGQYPDAPPAFAETSVTNQHRHSPHCEVQPEAYEVQGNGGEQGWRAYDI